MRLSRLCSSVSHFVSPGHNPSSFVFYTLFGFLVRPVSLQLNPISRLLGLFICVTSLCLGASVLFLASQKCVTFSSSLIGRCNGSLLREDRMYLEWTAAERVMCFHLPLSPTLPSHSKAPLCSIHLNSVLSQCSSKASVL